MIGIPTLDLSFARYGVRVEVPAPDGCELPGVDLRRSVATPDLAGDDQWWRLDRPSLAVCPWPGNETAVDGLWLRRGGIDRPMDNPSRAQGGDRHQSLEAQPATSIVILRSDEPMPLKTVDSIFVRANIRFEATKAETRASLSSASSRIDSAPFIALPDQGETERPFPSAMSQPSSARVEERHNERASHA